MSVQIEIVEGALKPLAAERDRRTMVSAGVGAHVVFEGIVRGDEAGEKIAGLEYQAYEPMAGKQLRLLADEMVRTHGLIGVEVWHSRGLVRVGEVSFRLVVRSAHRKEAMAAMDEFIDRMKKDVPIWKKARE